MAKATSEALPVARSEPRTRIALLLEWIALRHQIAVLERGGTRRPCFRLWDRFFWIMFSRWWSKWRDSLNIVQPETVLRWCRDGWSALRKYRSRGRWRGGRPRISAEVRGLIAQMARQNFLWGAPRIHGELLMLGFSVSQATVSRYLPARCRWPGQSWRTFLRSQASAFGQYSELRSMGDAGFRIESYWAQRKRSVIAQFAAVGVGRRCGLAQPQLTPNVERTGLRAVDRDRSVTHAAHRSDSVSGGSRRALYDRRRAKFPIRSPPQQACGRDCRGRWSTKPIVRSRVRIHHAGPCQDGCLECNSYETGRPRELCRFRAHGLGFEERQAVANGGHGGMNPLRHATTSTGVS
jgi:hypothetical protein